MCGTAKSVDGTGKLLCFISHSRHGGAFTILVGCPDVFPDCDHIAAADEEIISEIRDRIT